MFIDFDHSPYRDAYISFSFLTLFVGLEISILLFYKSKIYKNSAKISSRIFLALGFAIAGDFIGLLSLTLMRFFTESFSIWSIYFYTQGWFFIEAGIFLAALVMEITYRKTFRSYFSLSIISGLGMILSILNWLHPIIDSIVLFIYFISGGFLAIFLIILIQKSSRHTRKMFWYIFTGYSIFYLSLLFVNQSLLYIFHYEKFLVIAHVVQFLSTLVLFYAIYQVPVLNDLDWRESLIELYILSKDEFSQSGTTVFYYNFKSPSTKAKDIYAGGIIGIESIIQSISADSKNVAEIEEINQDEETLILSHLHELIGVLVVKNHFQIHHSLLDECIYSFHEIYDYLLHSCCIDPLESDIFHGFNKNVEQIFFKT